MNWRRFTSRKFLSVVAMFVASLCVLLKVDGGTAEQIIALISNAIIIIVYIKTEGALDLEHKEDSENGEE